jgi:broad specificity phosphatase PhoE
LRKIEEFATRNNAEQVVAVSHGTAIRALVSHLRNKEFGQEERTRNCGIVVLENVNGQWKVIKYNGN